MTCHEMIELNAHRHNPVFRPLKVFSKPATADGGCQVPPFYCDMLTKPPLKTHTILPLNLDPRKLNVQQHRAVGLGLATVRGGFTR